jgi:hypothetical protein
MSSVKKKRSRATGTSLDIVVAGSSTQEQAEGHHSAARCVRAFPQQIMKRHVISARACESAKRQRWVVE